jgi:hypothetical protein
MQFVLWGRLSGDSINSSTAYLAINVLNVLYALHFFKIISYTSRNIFILFLERWRENPGGYSAPVHEPSDQSESRSYYGFVHDGGSHFLRVDSHETWKTKPTSQRIVFANHCGVRRTLQWCTWCNAKMIDMKMRSVFGKVKREKLSRKVLSSLWPRGHTIPSNWE